MTYVPRQSDFRFNNEAFHRAVPAPARPGVLRRLFDAIMDGRQKRAQRDIDFYVATHGSRMTDTLEREINHRLLGDGWAVRR